MAKRGVEGREESLRIRYQEDWPISKKGIPKGS